ncbi:serine hydrolase domain-containing protein [Bacillus horti]|uniref:CubicO group peptidase (Beta-lactamase class C family) n=1 Tax=Caldalkalibacillus horti TaxID=77523 RepID=A0ABT9VZL0_9BACI|nr:serine hydrolase domain-containing protein [Bacillus horti]MDQ0166309.1 CubicO group peptidase (beta-lactamase class C family) [Bacillus horti]
MKLSLVLTFLENEIKKNRLPGAVLHVSHRGQLVCQEALGYKTVFPTPTEMKLDTVFDLASLTKVIATLPATLKLLEEGKLGLYDSVSKHIPEFDSHDKDKIRIFHLLTHSSGLVADRPYHKQQLAKKEILEAICAEQLIYEPGQKVIYSDLGMILLSFLIERVTGEAFDQYCAKVIFDPLDMKDTGFNPSFPIERYAATELCPIRQEYKCGIVHDEKAETMGGVSGHAGLFSTVQDLAKFARMIELNGRDKPILSEASIRLSKKNFTPALDEGRGLGWMMKSPISYSACGELFSDLSYGHTGFTGTSLWFDPEEELHVILLTNRVHYGREPHILDIRPKVHNMIRAMF